MVLIFLNSDPYVRMVLGVVCVAVSMLKLKVDA